MKQALAFLLVSFGSLQAQTWQQLPDFPGVERDDGVAFVINGKGYCGTGFKTGYSPTADFYSLDLSNNTWSVTAPLPAGQERQYACAVSYSGKGYLFGGAGSGYFSDLWCYDPALNTWTQLSSKPGAGLSGAACFVIGTVMYIIGGSNVSTYASSEVWSYNFSTSTWLQKNSLPFNGCWRASAATVNNKGYLIFGKDVNLRFRKELYEYDPGTDVWTLKSSFPNAGRVYATIQNINNKLTLLAGLDTLSNYYNDVWSYDISPGIWTQNTSLPSFGRKGGMCFTNGTALYYTTGIDVGNNRLKETWKADFPLGIEEYKSPENKINVYPNPAREEVCALLPDADKNTSFNYKLFRSNGSEAKTGTMDNSRIGTNDLPPGVYQLLLFSGARTYIARIIVQ